MVESCVCDRHDADAHAQQPRPAVAAATPTPQMSDKVFKNVQVLKGITVDEFMGTMGVYTTSLSLCCGNCHVGAGTSNPKWEDDSNPRKRMARTMTQMVQNINKTNFGGRQVVTCWTCHRGQLSPSVTPPLDFAYGDAVVNPPDLLSRAPNAAKTVEQIFAKLIEAQGGQARLNQITSYSGKGKSLLFGEVGEGNPAEIYAKTDGHFATYVHQQEGDVVRAYDGANAWWQLPLTVTPQYPLTATLLEGQKFDAAMAFPWRVRNFFTNRVSFDRRLKAWTSTSSRAAPGWNDRHDLCRQEDRSRPALHPIRQHDGRSHPHAGRVPEYRDVNGVKLPFTLRVGQRARRLTMTGYDINPRSTTRSSAV